MLEARGGGGASSGRNGPRPSPRKKIPRSSTWRRWKEHQGAEGAAARGDVGYRPRRPAPASARPIRATSCHFRSASRPIASNRRSRTKRRAAKVRRPKRRWRGTGTISRKSSSRSRRCRRRCPIRPPARRIRSTQKPSPRPAPSGGSLGEALKNLRQYTDDQTFANPDGNSGQFGPSIQFDTKGVEFGPWIRRFVAQIKRNWFIPLAAMSLKGSVVLTLQCAQGRQHHRFCRAPPIQSTRSTTQPRTRERLDPTHPLPQEYPSPEVLFTVTFYYNESPPPGGCSRAGSRVVSMPSDPLAISWSRDLPDGPGRYALMRVW